MDPPRALAVLLAQDPEQLAEGHLVEAGALAQEGEPEVVSPALGYPFATELSS